MLDTDRKETTQGSTSYDCLNAPWGSATEEVTPILSLQLSIHGTKGHSVTLWHELQIKVSEGPLISCGLMEQRKLQGAVSKVP